MYKQENYHCWYCINCVYIMYKYVEKMYIHAHTYIVFTFFFQSQSSHICLQQSQILDTSPTWSCEFLNIVYLLELNHVWSNRHFIFLLELYV